MDAKPAKTAWVAPVALDAAADADDYPLPNDNIAVLLAEHETDEEFEADCIRRLNYQSESD